MDSVRFGRALGTVAKGLAGAVEAAAAPNPSPSNPSAESRPAAVEPAPTPSPVPVSQRPVASHSAATHPIATAARSAARTTFRAKTEARNTSKAVARGGKRFGEAVWSPLVKLSGILWLEITGAFFGLFALFAGQAAWTHRTDLYSTATHRDDRIRAFVFLAMALAFGYFCLTSFFHARRRERQS